MSPRIDLQVPADLPIANGAEGDGLAVRFGAVVTAVHAAVIGGAMLNREDVPRFVPRGLERAAEAKAEGVVTLGGIAVAGDGPNTGPLAETRLPEDEVPVVLRIQIGRREREIGERIGGPVLGEDVRKHVR